MQQASNHSTDNKELSHILSYTQKEGLFATFQPTTENLPFIVMTDHTINLVINTSK